MNEAKQNMKLGVNIDHIATIREARRTYEPDPVFAAYLAELAGADCITVHLREDRRHIRDRDVILLRQTVQTRLNLEMARAEDVIEVALKITPDHATLVPERREEVTTEGGLDVAGAGSELKDLVERLKEGGTSVSMFIDPDPRQIDASKQAAADAIEIHTGRYANAEGPAARQDALDEIRKSAAHARSLGLTVLAGHGLTYRNVRPIVEIPEIGELNIGHTIISRAAFVGIERAVREMKELLKR
ncbi:MAG: pyridoxine 5'-phosphate synthase [Planctomycetota bacterium]|nr:MAG: pyridoxine 5'-phosphate synthase [Planctomycetota bacterium]